MVTGWLSHRGVVLYRDIITPYNTGLHIAYRATGPLKASFFGVRIPLALAKWWLHRQGIAC